MVDYARFLKDDDNSYLELYYSFNQAPLEKVMLKDKYFTELYLQIIIKNKGTGYLEVNRRWNIQNEVPDSLQNQSQTFVGLNRFILGNGLYSVLIYYQDIHNPGLHDSTAFDIIISPSKETAINLSDIEFCTSIKQIDRDTSNIFYKNSYEVKPNPISVLHSEYPLLGYYIECYNLKKEYLGSKIITRYRVLDNLGNEAISKVFRKDLNNPTSIELGITNLNKLIGGPYTFNFSILDSNNKIVAEKSKKLFIYDPNQKPVPISQDSSFRNEYSFATIAELDYEFSLAKYIASTKEVEHFALLKTVESKRNFLIAFWMRRESDQLYNKESYLNRVNYAKEKYRTKFREGWRTDRGRVCVLYGIPEEPYIRRGEEDQNGHPYLIWFYPTVLNGTYFVFVDDQGFSNYRLVHSSHPNEVSDSYWQDFLKNMRE
jgi:GWxTD domain-containing protein